MKNLFAVVVSLFVIGLSAQVYAETAKGHSGHQARMGMDCMAGDMNKGKMMDKKPCMSMMQNKTGQGMMMKDMVQMMMDIINIQQGMMKETSPDDRKALMAEADKLKEKMEKMMTGMSGMMPCMMGSAHASGAGQEKKDEPQMESAPKQEQHKH